MRAGRGWQAGTGQAGRLCNAAQPCGAACLRPPPPPPPRLLVLLLALQHLDHRLRLRRESNKRGESAGAAGREPAAAASASVHRSGRSVLWPSGALFRAPSHLALVGVLLLLPLAQRRVVRLLPRGLLERACGAGRGGAREAASERRSAHVGRRASAAGALRRPGVRHRTAARQHHAARLTGGRLAQLVDREAALQGGGGRRGWQAVAVEVGGSVHGSGSVR